MKKVLFIATYAYPLFNENCDVTFGGSELQVSLIAKELASRKNYDVSILVGDFSQEKIEKINNVKLIKTINPRSDSSIVKKLFQSFVYWYHLIKNNPDTCFTSSANSTVGLVSIYCQIFNKKHVHRIASAMDCNFVWIKNNGYILGKLYQFGLESASQVICHTEDQKIALALNHKIDATNIRKVFICEPDIDKKTDSTVLWVGKASKLKRPEIFLSLAKRHPHRKFVMICNPHFDENFYKSIADSAKKIENMFFLKEVKFSKIQAFFNKAKLYVNTSSFEGFAYTFIQAGNGKTPILSLACNPDDFITKHNCGIYTDNNEHLLSDAIEDTFKDVKLYNRRSENIFKYIKDNFEDKENIEILIRKI